MQRAFAVPVVKDGRTILLLFRCFAPVSRRELAILLPSTAAHLERAVATSRDLQKTNCRGFLLGALRQGKLPPQAFNAREVPLIFDRMTKLFADDFHHAGGGRSIV